MQLFVYVTIAACLFQAYHSAPVSNVAPSSLTEIRSELEKVPGVDEKTIDSVVTLLKNYENDPLGLLTLALQQDTCTKNRINLRYILETAFVSDVEEKLAKKNEESFVSNLLFTENELKIVEMELSKSLTPEKVQNAKKLLRGFQSGDSEDDFESAGINMMLSAAKGLNDGCPTEKTEN